MDIETVKNLPWESDSKWTWYRILTGTVPIIIHRHIDDPAKWFVTCYHLSVEHRELKATDLPEAMCEGINYLKHLVGVYSSYLNSLG